MRARTKYGMKQMENAINQGPSFQVLTHLVQMTSSNLLSCMKSQDMGNVSVWIIRIPHFVPLFTGRKATDAIGCMIRLAFNYIPVNRIHWIEC